jgi:hypothetical protein
MIERVYEFGSVLEKLSKTSGGYVSRKHALSLETGRR